MTASNVILLESRRPEPVSSRHHGADLRSGCANVTGSAHDNRLQEGILRAAG
ncbi:hypothetical protein [Streptomyces uncialis]|uniref:hypothetical protein n=1 Tax=Streptomyces uncialis TaxID=1048205 RepID=UPI002254007A|nr:hypothetical protein [Streptomyces uncialis]